MLNSDVKKTDDLQLVLEKSFDDRVSFLASRLTGEKLPFRTPYSAGNDKGVKGGGLDLCHTEEFVPISEVVQRYLRGEGMDLANEFAYDADELSDEDSALDVFDNDDPLDRQLDLEDYLADHPAVDDPSDSADVVNSVQATDDKQGSTSTSEEDGASLQNVDAEA